MLSRVTYRTLAHPFQLDGAGHAATVQDGTDPWVEQLLQVTIGTNVNDRDMAWAFGVPDPVWHGLGADDVQAAINLYGPAGVSITDVLTVPTSDTSATIQVVWFWASADQTDDVTG
jgi:hypothetical protein